MFFAIHSFFLYTCFISIIFCNKVSSDEVPSILWNIKGNTLQIKPISALGQDDSSFDDTLKDIIQQNANILVFATNKLSLEDFSSEEILNSNNTLKNLESFLDTQRYMFMSSVKTPLSRIHDVHCGVQEIVVDQSIDENVLQSVSLAFDRSCVVILHISDANVIGVKDPTPEDIRLVFQPAFEKNSKDVVGIFTAMKTSWGKSNEDHHRFRNLLATEESEANFINITGCLIMYAENATLRAKVGNKTVDLPFPVDTKGSECGNVSTILMLNFKPTSEYTSVVVKFNFTVKGGSWTTEAYLETEGGKEFDFEETMHSGDLHAPLGFSWSCGNYELKNRNSTKPVTVIFEGFQVQPFRVNEKFSNSFDCVAWFTVPIWMGIFVSILFVAIINCGVYALFSVHTMDRFDDPKGKTISVTAAVD